MMRCMRPGQRLLAVMVTTTMYGTWLPGDVRGYVDAGRILPGDPTVLRAAVGRMIGRPVYLSHEEQARAFGALCGACEEFGYALRAVSIESWHAHWLIDAGYDNVSRMVGRLKTRMRQAVGRGRIWTAGFDKRFCFDQDSVQSRQDYIARHRGHRHLRHPL